MRIGIPRALLYYKYYPMWVSFLEALGFEVVVSGPTNRVIVERGIASSIDEECLPCKVFKGHVLDLLDRVDALFIPRIKSVEEKKSFTCPRHVAMPDCSRNSLRGLPVPPIISPYLFLYKRSVFESYLDVSHELGMDEQSVLDALNLSLEVQARFSRFKEMTARVDALMRAYDSHSVDFRAVGRDEGFDSNSCMASEGVSKPKIGVVGHPYILYDSFISMNLIRKLEKLGFAVVTGEMLNEDVVLSSYDRIIRWMHWTYEKEILGAANYFLESSGFLGLVYVASFGCGPAALIGESIVRYAARFRDKVMLHLVIDEHTAEAGMVTRLEAFADMVYMKTKAKGRT